MPMYEVIGTPPNHTLRPLNGPYEVKSDGTIDTTKPLQFSDNGLAQAPDPPTIHPSDAAVAPTTLLTRTSAQVNWDAPTTGAEVVGYEVWRDNALVTTINSPTTLTYTETGLPTATPERIFTYTVKSIGSSDTSGPSAPVTLQWNAAPAQVPTAPLTLTRGTLTDNSVSLSWTVNADGTVTKYTVHASDGTVMKDNVAPDVLTTTVTGLTANTQYTMYVTRSNSVGESGPSPSRTFTTTGGATQGLVPGQIQGRVIMGMATDNYAARVAEVGKNGADHSFVGSWNVSGMISDIQTARSRGVFPLVSMKVNPNTWGEVANGALDSEATNLANQIKNLGYPCRISFHHEPAGNGGASSSGDNGTLGQWRDMLIRLFGIIGPIATNAVLGPIDNGYKWSAKAQGWTDAELATVYTPQLLAVCDTLGSDCYDGSSQSTPQVWGENAAVKAGRMLAWANRIGWTGPLDIGEWNFIRPQDATAMWNVFSANPDRWWLATVFNSDNNNRADIPDPPGHWNFTHDYASPNDRLNAYKAAVNDPIAYP
jgi:hypothetical protein